VDKKLLESESQMVTTKSASEQTIAASATTPSVIDSSSSTTVAVTANDQSGITATVTTAPDAGKKSPEPGSPDWIYADLPVSEVRTCITFMWFIWWQDNDKSFLYVLPSQVFLQHNSLQSKKISTKAK